MKKFIFKCLVIIIPVYIVVAGLNYYIDPANLFNNQILDQMTELMLSGETIVSPGDVGEGLLMEKYVEGFSKTPQTLVIGSSHVMYIPFEYEDYKVVTLSGAYLGDYLAVIGLLESNGRLPERLVLGIDPWAFTGDGIQMRHTSISPYKDYMLECIDGVQAVLEKPKGVKALLANIDSYKEMFSFAYFQSSLANISKPSMKFGESARIKVCDSDEAEDMAKILPNGRRVMPLTAYKSVEENNASAISELNARTMYNMYGFTEISSYNKEIFDKLMNYLLKKGVEVELYLPAWYPLYYDTFMEDSQYSGVLKVEEYIRSLDAYEKITVHGTYNPYEGGLEAEDFADSFHLKPEKMLENYKYLPGDNK